ncbi:helix-turn-helix domain-containing protein [Prevotella denticola]|uniref:helix-turn-helix domain-containing protein n=1 Tax=Prevotella denticola TaxID=28129 RepID=UPI0002013A55|nr:helix-turn-helix domain-containing protein [Prevotella denticola]AEA20568.1 transcriptional regulator, AraC family [Prevotella denticola F0289]
MNDEIKSTAHAVSDFDEIVSYMKSGKAHVEGDIYMGSRFLVVRSCNPFFKPIIEEREPVRFSVVRVVIVKSGWCEPVIGFRKYRCGPGDMLFLNWGVTISSDTFGVDTTFEGIALTEEYMKTIFGGRLPELFVSPDQCFVFHLGDTEQEVWGQYTHTLFNLVHLSTVNEEVAGSLFVSALNYVESLYNAKRVTKRGSWSRNKQTVERFVRLVNDYAKTEHEIEFYASQLCMTAHYLGMVVKKETGITAKEWIDKTLAILIQLELRYTSKSLKMIANEFEFVSLSSLCKFFKRRTGITATEYRMMPEDTPCSSIETPPPPINNCKLLIYNMLLGSRYPFLNETSRSSRIFLYIYTSFRPFFSWGHSGSRSKWIEAGVLSA